MPSLNEAEKIFLSDIKEKKRETASRLVSTKGRRMGKNRILLPSDTMSRKEKLKHTRAGKVMTTNIFDNILPIAEFEQLETYEKKNRLQYWRNKYSNKEILSSMGIANKRFYDIIKELDLPKAPRTYSERPKRKAATTKKSLLEFAEEVAKEKETTPAPVAEVSAPVQEIIIDGLHLVFNGTYKAEQIIKQLSKFELLLTDEPDDFYIELKLVQKQPVK